MNRSLVSMMVTLACGASVVVAQQATPVFTWPNGRRVAVSLSFDDGRASQVDGGTALLDRYGVKATFYVVPSAVEKKLEGWKRAAAGGHEIGNHSLNHPCSGNFAWSRGKALEDYTLDQMRRELTDANRRITELLGVTPESFAYPCGQTFVGRGVGTQSYVPVVASSLRYVARVAGRGAQRSLVCRLRPADRHRIGRQGLRANPGDRRGCQADGILGRAGWTRDRDGRAADDATGDARTAVRVCQRPVEWRLDGASRNVVAKYVRAQRGR